MNISSRVAVGTIVSIAAISMLAPTAAFATSSVSWSQATICPGESVTLTVNGLSDGTVVNLTAPEYATVYTTLNPTPFALFPTASTGAFPYGAFQTYVGETYTYEIVSSLGPSVSDIQSVVSAASIQVLAECAAPAPVPEAEALPNTGSSSDQIAALALGGATLALGGVVLARRARRATAGR